MKTSNPASNRARSSTIGLVLSLAASCSAATWTCTNITPAGQEGFGWGVANGKPVGTLSNATSTRNAAVWDGATGSYVFIGNSGSIAYGAGGSQQVGIFVTPLDQGRQQHACMWSGAPGTMVDLHPLGTDTSTAFAAGAGEQAGCTYVTGGFNGRHLVASLWHGTAASWVNLAPAGVEESIAYGVGGGQQVGYVRLIGVGSNPRAALWSGSAASWVNLDPAGSDGSIANTCDGVQQGGYAMLNGYVQTPGFWTGSAASWVSLMPTDGSQGEVRGVSNGEQVGYVRLGDHLTGLVHVALWHGTAGSWEDLSAYLPPEIAAGTAVAQAIGSDGSRTYVVGFGYLASDHTRSQALVWTRENAPPPVCVGDINNDHQRNTADLAVLLGSFGQSVAPGTNGDVNNDGVVNTADLLALLGVFGQACS